MELIKTQHSECYGNDCLIKDEVVMFLVHEKYVVIDIRRYTGWCDDGELDFRHRKEFDDYHKAIDYFYKLYKSECSL